MLRNREREREVRKLFELCPKRWRHIVEGGCSSALESRAIRWQEQSLKRFKVVSIEALMSYLKGKKRKLISFIFFNRLRTDNTGIGNIF